MNHEKILDALEFIDDDMIERVDILRKVPERPRLLWLKYVSVAACVALAIFGGFKFFDSRFATQENSSSDDNINDIQNGIVDIYGDTNYKDESAEQLKTDDNATFRDEPTGGTSGTSNKNNFSFTYSPVYIEITEISESSFKGRVINRVVVEDYVHFEENQVVTVVYRKDSYADFDTLLIKDLNVGEKVYVIYNSPADTIDTSYIRYDDKF